MAASQIIVYLEKLEPGQTVTLTYQVRAKFPIKAKTPVSKVYPYYNPVKVALRSGGGYCSAGLGIWFRDWEFCFRFFLFGVELNTFSIDIKQATKFLKRRFAKQVSTIQYVGEGAWSRCFGFKLGQDDLVIRFGRHLSDFQKDQIASKYATADLPIPKVAEIGEAEGMFYAISTRAYGTPLEELDAVSWISVVPSLVRAMEAMRTADISETSGFGGWDEKGKASSASWSEELLAIGEDDPGSRTHGWKIRLENEFPEGAIAFARGFERLKEVASDNVPRSLIHCDLMNRNALVDSNRVSGVFDWGCSLYGDHLYELAWFEFWGAWHPNLNIPFLSKALKEEWERIGYTPLNQEARLQACRLVIGLDSIAYNAYLGQWKEAQDVIVRMEALGIERNLFWK